MKSRFRFAVMVLLAGMIAAFLVACGDDDDGQDDGANDAAPTQAVTAPTALSGGASGASISIVEPADGWTVEDDRIEVQVDVDDFVLDGTKIGQPAADNAGVGHWHVYVDGEYAGLSVSDVVSLPNDAMTSIAAGSHEISVQLHNTDHTPVLPEALDAVTIEVPEDLVYTNAGGDPFIEIVSPEDGATVDARTEVRVTVSGVVLDGTKIGSPASETAGIAHWHVYVDGEYAGLSVSDVVSLPNDAMPSITPGSHEITVQLHNTDHTPLTPERSDAVTVTFP